VHTVTLTVTGSPGAFHVHVPLAVPQQETGTSEPDEGPSPIQPETKELLWGAGSFIVLLILVRLFLYPKIKKGMDARYAMIRDELETADATRASAEAELSEYEAQLAKVRAEAASRIDAARQTLETERQARLADVNGEIAAMRSAAAAEWETARASAQDQVAAAAARVAATTAEKALGRPVDPARARAAVDETLSAGART
jgi:F-type H+-transporting ATPase subunit b